VQLQKVARRWDEDAAILADDLRRHRSLYSLRCLRGDDASAKHFDGK
jgi:hypothetical protein